MSRRHTLTKQTRGEWERLLVAFNYCCAYCGRGGVLLQREHMVPRIRGGGEELENILPACGACNSSKCDSTPLEWFLEIDGTAFKHLGRKALLYGKETNTQFVEKPPPPPRIQPHPTAYQDPPCKVCGGVWFRPLLLWNDDVVGVCVDCLREAEQAVSRPAQTGERVS